MKNIKINTDRIIFIGSLIIALMWLAASAYECSAQEVISLSINPNNPGLGATYKKNGFVSTVNYGMVNRNKTGIDVDFNKLKMGVGVSFNEPNIFGTWDNASFDVIFCGNWYFGSSKQYTPSVFLIPSASYYYKDKLRFLTIEVGAHKQIKNNIVLGFHWDPVNDEVRLNFGIKLLNKHEKQRQKGKNSSSNNRGFIYSSF